ncbi:MAG: response regulator [Faecousia sp.]
MLRKVVIIDDEPWTRGVIIKLAQWERLGLEVVGEAADGETGLELIRKVLPDIVITDVRMPRISGIELVQTLRGEGFQIPILIISGYDDFSYVRSALKLGVTDYLLKPIKAQELNQQLQRCTEILDREEIPKPQFVMEVGFFADGWEDCFSDIRRKLEAALRAGNCDIIRRQFDCLYEAVCRHEGEQPPMAVMIGIYYSVLFQLQRYVESLGANRDQVFGTKAPSFVFSHDNTLRQMIDFISDLYLNAVRQIEKQQQRTRLDIDAVCGYIQENYTQGVTLEQTADVFHVTKEYLSKAFKAYQNEGFSEYVTALRMKRAYALITEYEVPLKEVGAMVGYFDLAHFYKTFKKFFGKTPGEVRESLKNDNRTTP